jgi:transposase
MNAPLVTDDLWKVMEPLLPTEPPKPKGGRRRVPDYVALAGLVFVLRTGCPWRLLPIELGCGSGTTCWRRLREWQEAGVWERLHVTLLNCPGNEATIDAGLSARGLIHRRLPAFGTEAYPRAAVIDE